MEKLFPRIGRKRIRLSGYDYALPGMYFVTMNVKGRIKLFGEVRGGIMQLNEAGKVIDAYLHAVSQKYFFVRIDAHVVMPDHVHAIIEIGKLIGVGDVGVDQRIDPYSSQTNPDIGCVHGIALSENAFSISRSIPQSVPTHGGGYGNPPPPHVHVPSLPDVIQWFKIMTTAAYIRGVKNNGWQLFSLKLWQRSYHERIIRDSLSLGRIRAYIQKNPQNWNTDALRV